MANIEASLEIQSALYTKIKALGYNVFDVPPTKETAYPIVIIGDDRQSDLEVKNGKYINIMATVSVFSTYVGKKEAKTILEQIKNIGLGLKGSTYKVVGAVVNDSFVLRDDENKVTQGVIEFNFKLIKGV